MLIIIVYVDEIRFGGNDSLFKEFAKEIQKEFEMPMIGELSFFSRLQVNQPEDDFYLTKKVCERDVEEIWL